MNLDPFLQMVQGPSHAHSQRTWQDACRMLLGEIAAIRSNYDAEVKRAYEFREEMRSVPIPDPRDLQRWRSDEQGRDWVMNVLTVIMNHEETTIRQANTAMAAVRLLEQLAKGE